MVIGARLDQTDEASTVHLYGSRQHGILFEADIVLFLSAYIDAAMELTATARVILAE